MKLARGLHHIPDGWRGCVVTIGNFDGVHRGHQSLLSTTTYLAQEHGVPAIAITFEPHPRALLQSGRVPDRLTTLSGKLRCMTQQQLDGVLLLRFTPRLAALTPEQFVEMVLVEALAVRAVVVGGNFRFGAGGAGHVDTLTTMGARRGFTVVQPADVLTDGTIVSSTRIRQLVQQGQLTAASRLLGWPFEIEGRVHQGDQRGRSMGYPTANLPMTGVTHPPKGVYVAAMASRELAWQPAIANLGNNPTFGWHPLRLEVHLLRQSAVALYHRKVRVRLYHRLRDEKVFPDVQSLRRQIALDIEQAEHHLTTIPYEE
ncbi:MAG: bifunctional riboflavin kinase/FAD synthetase [Magnetococcales bacterium]|nr:bifunctional riboflavin kinase/FAD synthetase [Magnetococcales bacterium]